MAIWPGALNIFLRQVMAAHDEDKNVFDRLIGNRVIIIGVLTNKM